MRWWVARDGRRVDLSVRQLGASFEVSVGDATRTVELIRVSDGLATLLAADGRSYAVAAQRLGPRRYRVSLGDREFEFHLRDPLEGDVQPGSDAAGGPQELRAPIPGKVVSIAVAAGEAVVSGQPLLVLEAMKMENRICAEAGGIVETILVSEGETVEGGQVLVALR